MRARSAETPYRALHLRRARPAAQAPVQARARAPRRADRATPSPTAATRCGDAKIDIDGGAGTLAAYAELGASLGDVKFLIDGEAAQLTRSVRFVGQHIAVPREGVAVHVNAFNFPAWGMLEKAAVALLAGVPVISKPATSTALVAHRIVELIVESKALPPGALSFVAGGVGDLLSHLGGQDVLAFTGSSDTGRMLRGNERVVASSVRVNVEADSLNGAVLGAQPDLARDSEGATRCSWPTCCAT